MRYTRSPRRIQTEITVLFDLMDEALHNQVCWKLTATKIACALCDRPQCRHGVVATSLSETATRLFDMGVCGTRRHFLFHEPKRTLGVGIGRRSQEEAGDAGAGNSASVASREFNMFSNGIEREIVRNIDSGTTMEAGFSA